MARSKIKSATDQRRFTLVYNDFLESDLLDAYEKIVFIYLKKYADNETLKGFPSLSKICKSVGIGKTKLCECLDSMERKGVLARERRTTDKGDYKSTVYTLYDYAGVWGVDTSQEPEKVIDQVVEERMIEQLRAKGYTVTKNEKSLETATDQSTVTKPHSFNNCNIDNLSTCRNDSTDSAESQEKYSMDDIKALYEYDSLVADRSKADVDAVFNILYDALNTTRDTIRVMKEDKPRNVVISRLMKLEYYDIIEVIDGYNKQTEPIEYPDRYILTQLYKVKEQSHLKLMNTGHVNGDF